MCTVLLSGLNVKNRKTLCVSVKDWPASPPQGQSWGRGGCWGRWCSWARGCCSQCCRPAATHRPTGLRETENKSESRKNKIQRKSLWKRENKRWRIYEWKGGRLKNSTAERGDRERKGGRPTVLHKKRNTPIRATQCSRAGRASDGASYWPNQLHRFCPRFSCRKTLRLCWDDTWKYI